MYNRREVYPNAPLALVAAEVRYTYAPRLRTPDVWDAIQMDLEEILPIRRPQQMKVTMSVGAQQTISSQLEQVLRLTDRKSTTALTVTPEATTFETTAYSEYPQFRATLEKVLESIHAQGKVAAVERVGLRYIDEIRVPEPITDARSWADWVNPDLLAALAIGSGPVLGAEGLIQYDLSDGRRMDLRWAAVDGQSIVGNDPLKRVVPPPGPFFVLDWDSYMTTETEHILDFVPGALIDVVNQLHSPVGDAFQNTVTDRLRDHFRGETSHG